MITVNCYSNNVSFSQKLSQALQNEDVCLNILPLSLKVDRIKQISIYVFSNPSEVEEWCDYCHRVGIHKKNLIQKFILPLYATKSIPHELVEFNGIPLSIDLNNTEISLIKYLLQQKIDYFLQVLSKKLSKSEKFLLSVSPKLNWKDEVVLSSDDVSGIITDSNKEKSIFSFGEGMSLIKFWDTIGDEDQEQYLYFFMNSEVYRSLKCDLKDHVIQKLIVCFIFEKNYHQQKTRQDYTDFLINFYDTIFNLAPFPIAIELSDRDLIWQNKTFSNLKLLPRKVKKMNDKEKIHSTHGFFIVYKYKFHLLDLEYKLVYLAQQSEKFSNASEDLGIMTSSLAHEMNNPLSAIKAAIEVIGILDGNIKNKETLDQMLVSVNRCLQLVKIFLGFTKASFQLENSKIGAADKIPFRDCWEYAVQLMRTRLISASLRLQFHWNVKSTFGLENSNILTMMLYWLLSQFVNNIERKLLVSRSISHDQNIRITEDTFSIGISFDVSVKEIQTAIDQSLLMSHLLELEDLTFSLVNETYILIQKIAQTSKSS